MDSVIDKLTEIEVAASAIVSHAEKEKEELDREFEERRKEFDRELEEKTNEKIKKIQEELERDKKAMLDGQESASSDLIMSLQDEYETRHTEYAKEILQRITEV
ncbi:hypothetical protein [Sellimonas caecigallum]|uniref:ATPase n=1 Tax=Sellimonas caecigallum TaxID=2592333 RepID=A0ABS7L6R5_9FIRM|nr:hypothetical protein [Sellimonas caecigallum]MBY0758465.1 hypothetical protein [Sellimonas caecigallum]OUP01898.1 hypothetical protein B5F37_05190 [Drancourtella sp. An210]OUP67211.1 hypothetical protein B5F13_00300 [Drancourtella sp. An177]